MKNNILFFRRKERISQTELAKRANISRTHLNRIELGVADPSLIVAQKIAHALNKNIYDIFFIKDVV